MQKPWNIPDLPVYSLATYDGGVVNMNICTYVSAISLKPKWYAIAVYRQTKTLENIEKTPHAVLQLLDQAHYSLVKKLGQTSGLDFNKADYLQKRNLLMDWNGFRVLKGISALVLLRKVHSIRTGDHTLFTFEAIRSKSFHPDYLRVSTLRDRRIIRA